jgi:hypothetical protein
VIKGRFVRGLGSGVGAVAVPALTASGGSRPLEEIDADVDVGRVRALIADGSSVALHVMVDGNWSIFGEWDYLNFGTHNVTFTDASAGSSQFSVKQSINELKLGINYRFGNPLPQQYP